MGSNHRTLPYEGSALPLSYTTEDGAHTQNRTEDLPLTRRLLFQLSYTGENGVGGEFRNLDLALIGRVLFL